MTREGSHMGERTSSGVWKAIAFLVGGFIVLFVILPLVSILLLTYSNRLAENPGRIASKAGIRLPAYEVVERWDNFDRTSSAWSEVGYTLQLRMPLAERFMRKLERLEKKESGWSFDEGDAKYTYFSSSADDGPSMTIVIDVATGQIRMTYTWWDFLS